MQTLLQGSLRHFPVGELLTLFGTHSHTGSLVCEAGDRRVRVVLRGGRLAWAESADPAFGLVSMLSTHGLVTKEQLDELEARGMDANVVTPDQLAFYVSEIVYDLFAWTSGQFTFVADAAAPAQAPALEVGAIVEEGMRRTADVQNALSLYPDEMTVFRVVEHPTHKISLSPDEFKLLFRLGVGRNLAQLCEDLKQSPVELYPLVHKLQTSGLIEPVPPVGDDTQIDRDQEPATMVAPRTTSKPAPPPPPPAPAPRPSVPTSGSAITTPQPAAAPRPQKTAPGDKTAIDRPASPTTTASQRRTLIGSLTPDASVGDVYPLIDTEYLIGRDPSSSIAIADGSVSARHARILRGDKGFVIEDLKSRNGTFVNGEKVTEPRMLTDGDLVRLGKVILTFNLAKEVEVGQTTQAQLPPA